MYYRKRDEAIDEELTARVVSAYSRLYDHRIDVDAAFAKFRERCPLENVPQKPSMLRALTHSRWSAVGVACTGVAAALVVISFVTQISIGGLVNAGWSSIAGKRPVTAASSDPRTRVPVAGALSANTVSARASASPDRNQVPASIRSSRGVSRSTYRLAPGALQLTATLQPAHGGVVCDWIVTAGNQPARKFATHARPAHIEVSLRAAKTVTVESVPSRFSASPGTCAMTNVRVGGLAGSSVNSTASPSPQSAPVQPSGQPTPTVSGSGTPSGQPTPTVSGSGTPSGQPTPTPSGSGTASGQPTPTPSGSGTPTPAPTPTLSSS